MSPSQPASPEPATKTSPLTPGYAAPELAYFEGRFVPVGDASINIRTNGFLYGTSVFEGIRGYYIAENNSVSIFRLKEHYERMAANARMCYLLPDEFSGSEGIARMVNITLELVARNKPTQDIYIRPTLYKSGDMVTPTLAQTPSDFCLWTRPMGDYIDTNRALHVCVSNWRRLGDNSITPRAKAGGAYMNTALAVSDARLSGFDDAIFLTESGKVSEGSAMNLFLIKDGTLITPDTRQNILPGITRNTLIEIAKRELGVDTIEREIDRTELYQADEAFFCGTGVQLAPIGKIDHRPIGKHEKGKHEQPSGQIGELTRQLQALYFEVVKNRHLRYASWCSVVQL